MLQDYLDAVQKEKSYVGGSGTIEDSLWSEIKRLQRKLKTNKIVFPEYDFIECVHEDWI